MRVAGDKERVKINTSSKPDGTVGSKCPDLQH